MPKEITSPLHQTFVENVKARRKQLKLRQEDVASRLGMTTQAYGQIENGRFAPGIELIGRVADALEMPASELFAGMHVAGGV